MPLKGSTPCFGEPVGKGYTRNGRQLLPMARVENVKVRHNVPSKLTELVSAQSSVLSRLKN